MKKKIITEENLLSSGWKKMVVSPWYSKEVTLNNRNLYLTLALWPNGSSLRVAERGVQGLLFMLGYLNNFKYLEAIDEVIQLVTRPIIGTEEFINVVSDVDKWSTLHGNHFLTYYELRKNKSNKKFTVRLFWCDEKTGDFDVEFSDKNHYCGFFKPKTYEQIDEFISIVRENNR